MDARGCQCKTEELQVAEFPRKEGEDAEEAVGAEVSSNGCLETTGKHRACIYAVPQPGIKEPG